MKLEILKLTANSLKYLATTTILRISQSNKEKNYLSLQESQPGYLSFVSNGCLIKTIHIFTLKKGYLVYLLHVSCPNPI